MPAATGNDPANVVLDYAAVGVAVGTLAGVVLIEPLPHPSLTLLVGVLLIDERAFEGVQGFGLGDEPLPCGARIGHARNGRAVSGHKKTNDVRSHIHERIIIGVSQSTLNEAERTKSNVARVRKCALRYR